jgi:hypothetical protein
MSMMLAMSSAAHTTPTGFSLACVHQHYQQLPWHCGFSRYKDGDSTRDDESSAGVTWQQQSGSAIKYKVNKQQLLQHVSFRQHWQYMYCTV